MLILTLTGKSSVLAVNYSPAINLSDDNYELDLMLFETYHTISNINASNNKFYFDKDDAKITIPEGSYELQAINEFLKRAISQKRSRRNGDEKRGDIEHANDGNDGSDEEEYPIVLRADYNTMKSKIKCAYRIRIITLPSPTT